MPVPVRRSLLELTQPIVSSWVFGWRYMTDVNPLCSA